MSGMFIQRIARGIPWDAGSVQGMGAYQVAQELNLDFKDPSTLFDSTSGGNLVAPGGTIARVEPKFGAVTVTQAASASRPTRLAVSGIDSASFDGTDDFLSFLTPSSLLANTAKTIIAAFKGNPASTYDFVVSTRNVEGVDNNSTGYGYVVRQDSFYFHTGEGGSQTANILTRGNNAISVFSKGLANATTSHFLNGVSASETTNLGNPIAERANGKTAIGRQSTVYSGGSLYQLIFVAGVLSASNRQRFEGFLKAQGISTLPSAHPFSQIFPGRYLP